MDSDGREAHGGFAVLFVPRTPPSEASRSGLTARRPGPLQGLRQRRGEAVDRNADNFALGSGGDRVRDARSPSLLLLTAAPLAAEEPCAAGAAPLDAELALAFPGRGDGGTHLEATILVRDAAPGGGRAFRIDGEILRGDRRIDGLGYRLVAAGAEGPARLALIRALPAGHYLLRCQVAEEATGRCWRTEREVDVPALGAIGASGASGASADSPAGESGPSVRLLDPGDELLTGRVRFDAEVRDAGVARVAFELDGRRVMTRGRPPWSVELDLGVAPRAHRVAAIALSAADEELARDEIQVNGGPHRFAVRLALAHRATGSGEIEARAVVDVPEGETVDRLELLVNGELRAILHDPPFVQPLELPAGGGLVWVRAVALLAGGGAAEAVRLVGAQGTSESVDVDFVELHATVADRRGRPVDDLRAEELELTEDGRAQSLRRLERVADVPIHAGVLIDTSGSMAPVLHEAESAALRFFEQVITERDRAAVITFADEPRLAARFTGERERLAGGLSGIEADGETALYDAVVFALHYFSGLGGKRALVLLSDGADSVSKSSFANALEFARRSGVAIYPSGSACRAIRPSRA